MKIIKRIKKIISIAKNYDADMKYIKWVADEAHERVGRHTTVNADLHFFGDKTHQIIVIGKYRNRDYVRVFDLKADDWNSLVDMLHNIEKQSRVGRFDMPHGVSLEAVYRHDRF